MLEPHSLILLIPQQDDPIPRYADLLRSRNGILQHRNLRDHSLGPGVLQLESKFLDGVSWVGRRDDAAGEEGAPCYSGCVDGVGGVEGEYVAFLPVPEASQAFAEVGCGLFDLSEGVGAGGIGVGVDDCGKKWGVSC